MRALAVKRHQAFALEGRLLTGQTSGGGGLNRLGTADKVAEQVGNVSISEGPSPLSGMSSSLSSQRDRKAGVHTHKARTCAHTGPWWGVTMACPGLASHLFSAPHSQLTHVKGSDY
jgi:hypothetical protein